MKVWGFAHLSICPRRKLLEQQSAIGLWPLAKPAHKLIADTRHAECLHKNKKKLTNL
ncbi:MAG: hypothetical protein F6K44_10745 [Moorea sp. SIO3E2]|nr:hypothetical protein [Moorena sp. SIO3E2]